MLITQESHKKAQSLYETLTKLSLVKGISQTAVNKTAFLLSLMAMHTEMAKTKPVSEVLVAFLNDSGYLKYITEQDKLLEIDLLAQFYKKTKAFVEASVDPLLKNFLSQLNWELEGGEQGKLEFDPDQGPESIKIMTVHSAKGLEFSYVFVVSLVDKRFPSIERKDAIEIPEALAKEQALEGDIHLQEERRLFYVAITRAKQGLFLTSALNYGGKTCKKPSVFLTEAGLVQKQIDKKQPAENREVWEKSKEPANLSVNKWPLPEHFSFTQLAAFQKCPYQYKLAHILKVPIKGKASFSFGKTIHNTLNEFLRLNFQTAAKSQENLFGFEKANNSPTSATFEDLLALYEKNWIGEWYENKAQKEEYKKLGKEILKNFYDEFIKKPLQILKFNNELALEMPFHLRMGEYMLKGQIDRLEETSNGIRIVDYKTGRKKEKLEKEDKTQLLIYQIAVEEFLKLNPIELVYHYLEDGQELAFLGTEAEKQAIKQSIVDTIGKIKTSNFKATPGWQCQYCDFRSICHYVASGEE